MLIIPDNPYEPVSYLALLVVAKEAVARIRKDSKGGTACWIVSDEATFCTGFSFDLSGGRAVD